MQLRCTLAVLAAGLMAPTFTLAQNAARPDDKLAARPSPPKVGDPAPDFKLKGTDGKTYKLSDHHDKIVVLEWLNQDCPYSNFKTGIGPKAKALSEKHQAKGVVWLAIDSTHYRKAEEDAEYVRQNKIPHPLLLDPDGKVGHLYGARTTPHMFVINKGKTAYAGAFATHPRPASANVDYRGYVDEALEALLAGKEVPLSSAKPWGCSVKYKRGGRK